MGICGIVQSQNTCWFVGYLLSEMPKDIDFDPDPHITAAFLFANGASSKSRASYFQYKIAFPDRYLVTAKASNSESIHFQYRILAVLVYPC